MPTEPIDQAPPSSGTLEQIRPRRWPIVVVLLAVFAGGAIALVVVSGRMARAGREREARAWSTLQRCLLGPEPLAAGETPSARLRRIQLTAVGIPWRAKGQDAWPGWCSPRAHALHEALRDAAHAQNDAKDLAYWSEHLGKELHDHPYPENDIDAIVNALWFASKAQDLPPSEADDVPATPAAASPLTVDALKAVPPLSTTAFALEDVYEERLPSETLRLIVQGRDAPKAPFMCSARVGADAMTCAALPRTLENVQLRMLGSTMDEGLKTTTSAAPLLFTAPSGVGGIYRAADGSVFDDAVSYGGLSRADGFAAALVWDARREQFRLRRGRPGEAPRDTLFKLDGVEDNAQVALLADALVWAANGSVNVRHVLDADAPMGAAAVVAPVPEGGIVSEDAIVGCRTATSLAVLVRGVEKDTVTVDTGDRWSTPASFEAFRGRAEALTCRGSDLTFTAVRARAEAGWVEGRVTQARCTPGECVTKTTELAKVFPDVKETMPVRFAASELEGKLLLVWQAGAVGGLRLRLAPQDRIEEPNDTVIFDDLVQGGAAQMTSTLLGWQLFARGSYAVILLSTTAGVHAVRIDATGKATPLRVEWTGG